jgi:hypothetical protein
VDGEPSSATGNPESRGKRRGDALGAAAGGGENASECGSTRAVRTAGAPLALDAATGRALNGDAVGDPGIARGGLELRYHSSSAGRRSASSLMAVGAFGVAAPAPDGQKRFDGVAPYVLPAGSRAVAAG